METEKYKRELERIFALDFGSPYFPLLANIYLEEKDLKRAEKVCEIGLQYNPQNSDGQYVLSKVFIVNNQWIKAERLLKKVIAHNPIHLGAVKKLLAVLEKLNRSRHTMAEYHKLIIKIDQSNMCSMNWLKNYTQTAQTRKLKKEKKTLSTNVNKEASRGIPTNLKEDFVINEKMATFSMVQVLISQTHFHQALSTIEVLEKQNKDPKRIKELKSKINKELKLITKQNQTGSL